MVRRIGLVTRLAMGRGVVAGLGVIAIFKLGDFSCLGRCHEEIRNNACTNHNALQQTDAGIGSDRMAVGWVERSENPSLVVAANSADGFSRRRSTHHMAPSHVLILF